MNEVKEAKERGKRDFLRGLSLEDNPYRHYSHTQHCTRLMAWWDVGYQIAKMEGGDDEGSNQEV